MPEVAPMRPDNSDIVDAWSCMHEAVCQVSESNRIESCIRKYEVR